MSLKTLIAGAAAALTGDTTPAEKEAIAAKALQDRGRAAYLTYYSNGAFAQAKVNAGMVFTPELVEYLEREVQNRAIADQNRKDATKDMEHGTVETAKAGPDGGNKHAGNSGDAGPDGGSGTAPELGASDGQQA